MCGSTRPRFVIQIPSFSVDPGIIHIQKERNLDVTFLQNIVGENGDPQLLAKAHIWRNGGTDEAKTHICPSCIAVGLRKLKTIIDGILEEMGSKV